jgi:hypothetical protein
MNCAYKLMADYDTFPLWCRDADGLTNIDPRSIAITPELSQQLLDWSMEFDSTLNRADPAQSGFRSLQEKNLFDSRGRELWNRLQEELAGLATVSYYSVAEAREIFS